MYVVKLRFGRTETSLQEFLDERNAEHFIFEKLQDDVRFKVKATYCLYEGADLLREFTQNDLPVTTGHAASTVSAASGRGQGQTQVFNPSPLRTQLTPGGVQNNWKDVSKADDDQ